MASEGDRIILTDQVVEHPPRTEVGPFDPGARNPAVPVAESPLFSVDLGISPSDLFEVGLTRGSTTEYRFVRKNNRHQMLMFIDGSCLKNGTPAACAGWAVCLGPQIVMKGRLEPGEGSQTSNRAELRAAIAALDLRSWPEEGFNSIVLASDCNYVVNSYCEQVPRWKRQGWRMSAKKRVNKDLWQALDERIQGLAKNNAQVLFWRIPRELNEADKYAKEAAALPQNEGDAYQPLTRSVEIQQ